MRVFYYLAILWMIFSLSDPALAKHKKKKVRKKTYASTASAVGVSSAIYGTAALNDELNRIIFASSVNNASVAVYVKSMRSGSSLYTRNIYKSYAPASTMKVMTAEAALLFLGPNYRFSTQLLTDAKAVNNGVLQGNLYIVLSGDPTLTYADLTELMVALQTQHITAIAGNVYIDSTAYDQSFYGPGWVYKDKNYCYGAPISASIINRNCAPFRLAQNNSDDTTKYTRKSTNNYRSKSCSLHMSGDASLAIDGCMSKSNGYNYVVTDVPEYNRSLFKSLLQRLSVRVYGRVTFGSAPDNLSMVNNYSSEPLRDMIREMLKKSDNVIAGALFKKIGQLYSRQPGSWENGSLAVAKILEKNTGLNISGMRLLDGSGLSPYNLLTPSQMMSVLDFAYHHPTNDDFITALPIAGVDGTLKHRMGNIARKVRAKTGTISGVVSLAGYATTAQQEQLAFVILINGAKGFGWRYKAMEDKIATALTRYRNA